MGIHVLPEEISMRIAAGEVIDRPASVVKELIENSIDAHSSEIRIRVESGGRKLIEVVDNGDGIPSDEVRLAFERHATSKVLQVEDLDRIQTLGFRGEALASIAAVSHVLLESRVNNESEGRSTTFVGGKRESDRKIGMPSGTLVRVENLFFNTPARLKFLKQEFTERKQIIALVQRYALAYPGIRFILSIENKVVFQTSGNSDEREILSKIYSIDEAHQLLEVEYRDGVSSIRGFTSPVGLSRSNRKEMNFFINGRWIQDASLAAALIQAYHTYLMVGRYPIAAIFIQIPPEEVDVNVHPAKAEVRFKNPSWVFSLLQRAVRRTLITNYSTPEIPESIWHVVSPAPSMNNSQPDLSEKTSRIDTKIYPFSEEHYQPVTISGQIPLLRLVGQIGATYLVAEGPDGLYLIDQHAAHERILYEKFINQEEKSRSQQLLLEITTFTLPVGPAQLMSEYLPILNKIGFDIEEFGTNTFRIRAVPALCAYSDPFTLVRSVVEDFEENESSLQTEEEKRIIARICKRLAVRSGQILSHEEQERLINDLGNCAFPRTCPHGRPTMIHLSVDLLERQFGRKGSR